MSIKRVVMRKLGNPPAAIKLVLGARENEH